MAAGPGLFRSNLVLLACVSGAVFIGTMQPFGAGVGISDGGGLRRLAAGGDAAARDTANLELVGAIAAGVRPRDWPAETVMRALRPSDGSILELLALVRGANHAEDSGDGDGATALAARAWKVIDEHPRFLGFVAADLGLVALCLGDVPSARRALAHVTLENAEDHLALRVEAELAELDGRSDESRARARAGIAALERARTVAASARDRERLAWLAGER